MANATNEQKIAGLYTAFFNRAPDADGLNYWKEQFTESATVNDLAAQFAAHPVFTETYAGLTDVQFVQQIYVNVLGAEGDAAGIDYWVNFLKTSEGENVRADFVAQFVEDALTVDLSAFTDLTAEELAVAQQRQDTLTNKVDAGLYFAEQFGTASNITTDGDITLDPAYLAAQAAIANVTADPASLAAAKGRIDIAVGTNDPVDSIIGQNSELTAALVDYQNKVEAEADLWDALAKATDNWDETADQSVPGFTPLAALTDAEQAVADAAADVADANSDLATERAGISDAALAKAVVDAQDKVDAKAEVKELQAKANATKAAVAAGSDEAVLTALKAALAAYVDAGGKASDAVGVGGPTVGVIIDSVNAALAAEDVKTTPADERADALAAAVSANKDLEATPIAPATELNAAQKALNLGLKGVTDRQKAKEDAVAAETAFAGVAPAGTDEGRDLRAAEADVAAREVFKKAAADAAQDLADAQADLAAVEAGYDAQVAAAEAVAAAKAVIEGLGFELNTSGAGAAAKNDLFVATLDGSDTVAIGSFAAGDQLFIGTQYQNGGAEADAAKAGALLAGGDSGALEVFLIDVGGNATVVIEDKAFANAGEKVLTDGADVTTITLTGVAVTDLAFENGFVVFA